MAFTNAEQFAARGDEWNARNDQHPAGRRGWKRRSAFHGGGRELYDEIDGYDEPTGGPRAAIRKREFVEPNPPSVQADPEARRRANAQLRARAQVRKALRAPEVIHVR